MRQVNVFYLNEGEILAHPILDANGRILLTSGVKLTNLYIHKLQVLGVDTVLIEDDRLDDVAIQMAITPRTKESAYKAVKGVRYCIETNRLIRSNELKDMLKRMISDLLSFEGILGYISDFRGYDDFMFHHSVNTTIFALVLGMANKYSEAKLLELGLGVLMHDVGKVKIPNVLLNKLEKLTDEEFTEIKQHSKYGFEILRKIDDFGLISAHVALQHHERWDGSGYPRGLKGTAIHEYARLAALSDVYEALTSKRVYRDAIQPYQAYEYITGHSGILFEPSLINILSTRIAIYPEGSGVILNNGMYGNVVKQNVGYPDRPHVRMFYQADELLQPPVDYNLMEHPSLLITGSENR
ncbi:HD-GYP domain-containing protein [Desulfosporosinus sp. PR]|uniref:HD-GYP domain-containing protein n=1 Tax=Candidatus Desulfosporosinus nitrosoreducens TaxID=3401928 RepID=UPI0027EC2C80|nr:HD-GYP domain-containing protein [Desulfosporosinus sp. PR]MDQ7094633.1 HD-GYP domain-containing protein [Desulfosporosinus sp. PR]